MTEEQPPKDYYKALQTLFRTDKIEFIHNTEDLWVFEVKNEFLAIIKELGDDQWTMKVIQ